MRNYVLYDARKFQTVKFEVFQLKNVDFGTRKFPTFLPEMVKFLIFFNLIFCLISYDLHKPNNFVTESC